MRGESAPSSARGSDVCAECGHPTKPACDQDPDCPYHCFADEHFQAAAWMLDDFAYLHFSRLELAGVDVMAAAAAPERIPLYIW
jgi:hypothetical protein